MAGCAVTGRAGDGIVRAVGIRFDDGIDRAVTVSPWPDYRPGDRLRIEGGAMLPLAAKLRARWRGTPLGRLGLSCAGVRP